MSLYRTFTFEEIDRSFIYEEDTGKLFRVQITELDTTKPYKGRLGPSPVKYRSQSIMCTHIMFMLKVGRWPTEGMVIDHKDRDGSNHAWANLREATFQQNTRNSKRRVRTVTNEDLEKGVFKNKHGSYVVVVDGIYYGSFTSTEEANKVAASAIREAYGEFAYNAETGV